jgi:hypothetical protein
MAGNKAKMTRHRASVTIAEVPSNAQGGRYGVILAVTESAERRKLRDGGRRYGRQRL